MRYYSTTAGEMILQTAVAAGDTTVVVDTTAGLPVTYPFTLFLDYGSISEEVVDVTAAAGTSLTVTRGQDGTVAQAHGFGAKIRHGVSARDYRESRDHEASTAAHGVTTVVGANESQTLDNKTFQPSGDHAAVKVRPIAANATPAVDVRDESDARMAGWFEKGLKTFFGANAVLTAWQGGAVNLYKSILELRVSDDINALTGNVAGSPTGRFVRLMNGVTELFSVAGNGDLKARAGTFTSNVGVTGDVTASGNVSATNITSLGNRVSTLEGQTLDTRLSAVEGNLGSQTTFAATSAGKDGKRMHWGTASGTGDASGYFTVNHGAGFTPSAVVVTYSSSGLQVAADSFGATTFRVRVLNSDGSANGSTPMTLSYFCGE